MNLDVVRGAQVGHEPPEAVEAALRRADAVFAQAAPPIQDGSPEYREAIIAAVNEALSRSPFHATISDPEVSGRIVGALLKRGLRITPIPAGGAASRPNRSSSGRLHDGP